MRNEPVNSCVASNGSIQTATDDNGTFIKYFSFSINGNFGGKTFL